jgi:hypothetical protein
MSARPAAGEFLMLVECPGIAHLDALPPYPEDLGARHDVSWHGRARSAMDEDRYLGERRHSFLQQR